MNENGFKRFSPNSDAYSMYSAYSMGVLHALCLKLTKRYSNIKNIVN